VRVPIGVVGIIYESRPNVTIDCAALCLKSGNACILRGGKEAFHSNSALAGLIADETAFQGLDGRFDRQQFRQVLAQVGMSEADYINDIEHAAIRQQIVEAVADGMSAPDAFLDALHRFQGQTRDVSFIEIEAGDLPPIAEPTAAELIAFFEENLGNYRAPE